jgi:hypothetical protein
MRDSANSLQFKPAIAPVAALTNLNTPLVSLGNRHQRNHRWCCSKSPTTRLWLVRLRLQISI